MNSRALSSALVWAAAVLVVAGCTTLVDGRALSMLNDPSLSVLMSRYALAVQHARGLPMRSPWTALRTACVTGNADACYSRYPG